jgi:hypothetical protein
MSSAPDDSLVFRMRTSQRVALVLSPLVLGGLVFALLSLLRTGPVFAAVWALLSALLRVRLAYVLLGAEPPALLPEGVRLRPRLRRRATAVVPWAEITSLSIVPSRFSRTFLEVLTGNSSEYPGLTGNGLHYIFLSPSVAGPEQVKAAVERLTDGRVVVGDEPYRRRLIQV